LVEKALPLRSAFLAFMYPIPALGLDFWYDCNRANKAGLVVPAPI